MSLISSKWYWNMHGKCTNIILGYAGGLNPDLGYAGGFESDLGVREYQKVEKGLEVRI
jgi:hypothetical protein